MATPVPAVPPLPAPGAAAPVTVNPEVKGDVAKGKISLEARAKKLSLSVTIDTFAMLFMILAESGPSNLSLSWGVYSNATYPRVTTSRFNIYTGIFGTCRIPTTTNALPSCLNWWDDPFYSSIYNRFFLSSMAGLANFCIFILFFGALYACFRPGLDGFICMVTTGGMACLAWVPCFIMMTWLNQDLNNFLYPYQNAYLSAGFWNALVALILCFMSLGVKIRAYKAPKTADEKAAMVAMQAEMKRRQELQAQGVVVVPMQPMQPVYYAQPTVGAPMPGQPMPVGAAPPGYAYAAPPATAMYAAPPANAAPAPAAPVYAAPGTFAAPPVAASSSADPSVSVSVPGTEAKASVSTSGVDVKV